MRFDLKEFNSACRTIPAVVIPGLPCRPVIYMQATSWARPTETGEDLHLWPDYPVTHLGIIQPGMLIGGDNYASLIFGRSLLQGGLTQSHRCEAFRLMYCSVVCTLVSSHSQHQASYLRLLGEVCCTFDWQTSTCGGNICRSYISHQPL